LKDHSEAIEIGFDPARITYDALLEEFWAAHEPSAESWSVQYRNAVFVHDAAQRVAAERTRAEVARRTGQPVHTAIEEAGTFWQAEAYHQKWNLRNQASLFAEVQASYPEVDDLVRSTAAARLNAWAGGWAKAEGMAQDLDALGLSEAGRASASAMAR
jgi:peptide-methionine (S)-S-oxide reductase